MTNTNRNGRSITNLWTWQYGDTMPAQPLHEGVYEGVLCVDQLRIVDPSRGDRALQSVPEMRIRGEIAVTVIVDALENATLYVG